MNPSELDALMNAVLDDEATPDESRELDRILAADPSAKARFHKLQILFDDLGRIPMAAAPAGLVDSVMSRLPHRRPPLGRLRQLFSRSRVSRVPSTEARSTGRGNTNHRGSQTGPYYLRGDNMSERKIGSPKVWIGAAAATAAVVLALQYVDFPPKSGDGSGTIVPAQRYRAAQPTAEDVKLGGQSTPATSTDAAGNPGNGGQGAATFL